MRPRSAGFGAGGPFDAAQVAAPPAWAAVGLQTISAPTWRVGLLALRTDRGLTSRRRCGRPWRSRSIPGSSDPRSAGGRSPTRACFLPAHGRRARRGRFPSTWPSARRLLAQVAPLDPTLTLLASDQVSGPEAAGIAEAIRRLVGRRRLPDAGAPGSRRTQPGPPRGRASAELTLHEETLEVNDPDPFLRRLLATDGATLGSATNVAFLRSPLIDGMLARAEPARVPARAPPDLPAAPGAPRGGAAVRPALRPAPVDGGPAGGARRAPGSRGIAPPRAHGRRARHPRPRSLRRGSR